MHHVNGLTCFDLMVNLIHILGKQKKPLEAKVFRIWLETNPYSVISSVGVRKYNTNLVAVTPTHFQMT
jgi:hypothetical protein